MLLYRYEKAKDDRIGSLEQGKLWMSLPTSFNDPLDCQLSIVDKSEYSTFEAENLKQAALVLYDAYDLNNGSWLLDQEIVDSIREWAVGHDLTPKPHFLDLVRKRIQKFGIQCFSELVDCPLMWSHYANNHEGFCIEYEYSPMNLAVGNKSEFAMGPALYTSRLPEFRLTEILFSPKEVAERLYATKSEHWSYEKEYRLINFSLNCEKDKTGACVELPDGLSVKSIVAGSRTQKPMADKLQTVASKLCVNFEKMEREAAGYRLVRTAGN